MNNERMNNDSDNDNAATHSGRPSGLTEAERDSINQQLSAQARRRKQADPESVIVVVDGEERAHLQLQAGSSQSILLEEGDSVIELHARSGHEDLVLAIVPLAYTDAHGLAAAEETLWQGRNGNLALKITPAALSGEEPAQATATINFNAKSLFAVNHSHDRHVWFPRLTFPRLAFVAMALLLAVVGTRYLIERNQPRPSVPAIAASPANASPSQSLSLGPSPTPLPQVADAHISYRLVPDEQTTRGPEGSETVIALPVDHTVINFELPVPSGYERENLSATLKLFFKPGVILTENNLHPSKMKNDLVLILAVPSEKLKTGQEYAVEVQAAKAGQKPETVESYEFQTEIKTHVNK
jgi:hypothetical protein